MKTILCTLFLLCATAGFSQNGQILSSYVQPMQMAEHDLHASQHDLAQETSLLSTSCYSYAKGEVPLSELGSIEYETPLGDVARAFRKERATKGVSKAVKTLEK